MSGTVILNELSALCAEIRSEKATTRNKAAERLDNILTNSKADLIAIFKNKNQTNDISWSEIFNSVISATLKHAAKVEESLDSKNSQALRNKNHIFNAILEKIIDYSVEENNNFLTKSTLLTAFFDGCSIRSALKSFGMLFLYVLDTGIYKSSEMVCQLKVNEFSRILSYLFEINITNDENLRFAVLRSINKTIELAERYVQLNSDLVDYFPEIQVYASCASDDRRKSEVIKLFYLFISQLSVDYHSLVCTNIQDLLPVICGFYNYRMKVESKETFFKSVCIALTAIYPLINDRNCNSINITLSENWNKTLKKLETIMEMEIKERKNQLYRPGDIINERCFGGFIQMSALVVYLIHWHVKSSCSETEESTESRTKIRRMEDKLEIILALVQPKNTTCNEIWLAILADLISTYESVLNISNYQQVLEMTFQLLCIFTSASSIKHLRLCITSLLRLEFELLESKSIPVHHCKDLWSKLTEFLINDNSTNNNIISEKQLILQSLIAHKKLSLNNITELLQAYVSNKAMRRSECIATVRQILIYANSYELEKASELIARVINWICEAYLKIDAKAILLNIAPIEVDLLMDTSAIAVINFLDENEQFGPAVDIMPHSRNMGLLLYKYNRKIMCIEEHGMKSKNNICTNPQSSSEKIKNCLFQNNYMLLMRLLNLETSKEASHSDISLDLSHLNTLVCLMNIFLKYGVFSAENFIQCPLIKRIGFFLSHLEFQLKSNDPRNIDRTDLLEILQRIEKSFLIFTSNAILLNYLEAQPLDELITFVGKTLKFSATQHMSYELSDWSCITFACLKTLSILCASTSHFTDAFGQIVKHKFNMNTDLNQIMHLIQIFCTQRHIHPEVAAWFVNKIKTICQLYHTNVEISARIVELLPVIFSYVQHHTDSLDNMLIVLSSFLKKTYKKSYSINFAVNLMNSIREISMNCSQMCNKDDFTNICMSTAKFITCPSLEIQYATINTITGLMDAKWLGIATAQSSFHFEFCEKLMSQIDFKSLPTTTKDNTLNSVSVTTQLLVALFMFSSYHQEIALQELAYFSALRKLNECDFFKFQDIAAYFKCNLFELTSPYTFNLVHQWIEKQYPILKFPYFLCANTKDEFMLQNISKISSCILIHSKADHLKKLDCYKSQSELIEVSYSTVYAISLPLLSGCPELDTTKANYIRGMVKNLQLLGVSLQNNNNKSNNVDWKIIYNIMELFSDSSHFEEMFKFSPMFRLPKWFNIGYDTLLECLKYYLKRNLEKSSGQPLLSLISKHPLAVVHVFNALKQQITNSIFPIDKLKYYHIYCTFAILIIDCIEKNASRATNDQGSYQYFIRDIIYYSLQILQESQDSIEIQSACLTFVRQLLETPLVSVGFCNEILKSNFNYIIKMLVSSAENTHCSEIREMTTKTIHTIIYNNKDKFKETIVLLDEFPSNESFDKLREIQTSVSSEEDKDLQSIIKSFLKVENRGTESLKMIRNSIIRDKSQLIPESTPLCEFIKRLIQIVRNTKDNKFALEAAKCLGEIGSLKMIRYSYYFATDDSFYNAEAELQGPMQFFAENLLKIIEEMLRTFNKKTYSAICSIAEQLVNSETGKGLLGSFPYLSVFRKNSKRANCLDTYNSIGSIDLLSILQKNDNLTYDDWICSFVAEIYNQIGWKNFQELSLRDGSFAAASVIPIFKLLVSNAERHLQNICSMLDYFFNEAFNAISNDTSKIKSIYKEKRVIKKFLNVCECIRIHNEWNLPINLLHVAKACNYCQAYFLSIMYLEMWTTNEKSTDSEKSNSEVISNENFQDVSIKAYQSIGCCDAMSGFLNPLNSRIEFLNLEGSWSDVLLQADANATEMGYSTLYTDKLKRNGILALANLCKSDRIIDYETSWKLCQWDTIVEGHSKINTLNDMEHEFEKHHYNALKCIYNREEINSLAAITNARNCVISILKEISVECLQSVYKYLTCLHLLEQAENFCQVQFPSPNPVGYIFEKWETESNMKYGNFWCKEQTLSHKVTLFKTAGVRANRKIKEHFKDVNPVESCLLKCIRDCKSAGEMNLAVRNIAALKNMELSSEQTRVSVLLEDAELCFKTGKPLITKAILQHVLKNKDFAFCLERVKAYRMNGEYLMESNSETFETVLRTCFKGSIDLLKQFAKNKEQILARYPNIFDIQSFDELERTNRKQTYEAIAKYADREYTQLNIYINSEEFQMKCKIIQENRQAAESVGKQNKDRDKNIGAIFMKKFANLDEKEIITAKQKRSDFLCIAVESYMQFCKIDEAITSAVVYRIIGLWFTNKQNESLHSKIAQNLPDIPSYKFLCALNQMTARLSSKNKEFISLLKDILVRCAQDHPHHTLYQLFPLVFAFNDSTNNGNKSNDRVNITKEIISKAKNKSNSSCIRQLETMFPALIDFANETLKDSNTSLNEKLKRLKNLEAVQCPTMELPVAINKTYSITSIFKWEDRVLLVGGINAPKKLTCICSDGQKRSQLLKGKDDLRQDAVMQQVFTMINDLLKCEPETNERKLNLRTYKVVPLSMRSGILEWCPNTIPIGVYLAGDGKNGAHKKYRPNDYTVHKCRTMSLQHLKSDADKRLEMFLHVCSNIKPVFNYFFFEKFLVPGEWFERRLAYINSVATTSIVGFILGLGDRHTQNILIDEKTAEVIHIDFGIAFEQGKIMPTPETVPFRLTRDMVAPMGVCETNGVFKKSCEATMKILRRNQAVITTILEVLLYDPLYIWKVVEIPDEEAHEGKNLTAQRALLCVQNKLEGKQPGIFGTLDIEVQVQRLINDAILSQNLCMLYPGWDPYL